MNSLIVLFFLLVTTECRISISADGSITLAASNSQGTVRVEGDLVVSGRGISQELAGIQSSITNANQLALYSLTALRTQKLVVSSSRGSTVFTVGGEYYLLIANLINGANNQYLYKWDRNSGTFGNGITFTVPGSVNDFEVYTIGSTTYMVDANNAGSQFCNFRAWNGTAFGVGTIVGVQAVTYDWTFVNTGTMQFLAQGTEQTAANTIYSWNGNSWVTSVMTTSTNTVRDWNFFQIGTSWYAFASFSVGTTSELLSFNGANWVSAGTITTNLAYASDTFAVDGTTYLVIAQAKTAPNGTVSEVYRWNSGSFVFQSNFYTFAARNIKTFTIGNQVYCFVTNLNDGTTNTVAPALYKWNKYFKSFDLVSFVSASFLNNNDATYFKIDGKDYLHVVSTGDSFIYKLGIV